MKSRIALLAVLTVALAAAVGASAKRLGSPSPGPQAPRKQAVLQNLQERRAEAAAGPHAPKHPDRQPPKSCPRPIPTGIVPFRFGPFPDTLRLINVASLSAPNGHGYNVYAGGLKNDPTEGVLVVLADIGDVCAAVAGIEHPTDTTYQTPAHDGPVTIKRIEGVTLVFQAANGNVGRFNVVTGKFLSSRTSPPPLPPDKQAIRDHQAADRATAPPVSQTNLGPPAPTHQPPRTPGIVDTGINQGPFPASTFLVKNMWNGPFAGRWYLVYAGAALNPTSGAVTSAGIRIYSLPADPNAIDQTITFVTAITVPASQPVSIASATGRKLRLETPAGRIFSLDLATDKVS